MRNPVKSVQMVDFDHIFRFAEEKYGIHWNPCNDIFFGNAFEYRRCTEFYVEDWAGYIDLDIDTEGKKASDFSVDEVNAMTDHDKSYVITSAYFESLGVTGTVFINSD